MGYTVEESGKGMVKITIDVAADAFENALEKAYHKKKGTISIQGFRKGKAPRALIERMYGPGIFYEEAANYVIPNAYKEVLEESGLNVASEPEFDVVAIEKGQPFVFTVEAAVKPEVVLPDYKGIEVEVRPVEVADEEIDREIERVREQNARIITVDDRPIREGDIAVIDFEGFIDGVAFEGGSAEDYEIEIGSHAFIDTFEEQLVGKGIDEEVEVNVTFPTEYQNEELAGKAVMFKVLINEIKFKELPDVDDEFASDVSEYDTLSQYRDSMREALTLKREREALTQKENAVVDKLLESTELYIPSPMIEEEKRRLYEDYEQKVQKQGGTMEQYYQIIGMDADAFMEKLEEQATKTIKASLVLEAVVKAENIEITDEEFETELEAMSSKYMTEVDKLKEALTDEGIRSVKMTMSTQKAIDLITGLAVSINV